MSNRTIELVVPVLPVRDLTRTIDFYHCQGLTSKRYQDGDS